MAAKMAAIAKGLSCEKLNIYLSAPNFVQNTTTVTKEKYVQLYFTKMATNMAVKNL